MLKHTNLINMAVLVARRPTVAVSGPIPEPAAAALQLLASEVTALRKLVTVPGAQHQWSTRGERGGHWCENCGHHRGTQGEIDDEYCGHYLPDGTVQAKAKAWDHVVAFVANEPSSHYTEVDLEIVKLVEAGRSHEKGYVITDGRSSQS